MIYRLCHESEMERTAHCGFVELTWKGWVGEVDEATPNIVIEFLLNAYGKEEYASRVSFFSQESSVETLNDHVPTIVHNPPLTSEVLIVERFIGSDNKMNTASLARALEWISLPSTKERYDPSVPVGNPTRDHPVTYSVPMVYHFLKRSDVLLPKEVTLEQMKERLSKVQVVAMPSAPVVIEMPPPVPAAMVLPDVDRDRIITYRSSKGYLRTVHENVLFEAFKRTEDFVDPETGKLLRGEAIEQIMKQTSTDSSLYALMVTMFKRKGSIALKVYSGRSSEIMRMLQRYGVLLRKCDAESCSNIPYSELEQTRDLRDQLMSVRDLTQVPVVKDGKIYNAMVTDLLRYPSRKYADLVVATASYYLGEYSQNT